MKIFLHIVNNRPFCYAVGKDSEFEGDLKEFLAQAEKVAGTKFSQLNDRCEDNIDFFAENGTSAVHILHLPAEQVTRQNT